MPTPSSCPAAASRTSSTRSTAGPADYGVLPIENSIGGSIHRNFDLLLEHHLPIVGEVELPVVHHLLALPGTTLERVRRIYSHPQALAQCDRFLRTLTGVEIIATYDTAGSAKLIAEQKMDDAAAIASARAAEVFGLNALHSSIQDYEHNVTRFLVIGRRPLSDAPADKTTHCLHAGERAGRAVQGAERLRAARHRPDEARVAADSRSEVGVPLLRRSVGGARRPDVRPRAGAPRRVRADAARARFVSQLQGRASRQTGRAEVRESRVSTNGSNGSNPLTTGPAARRARAMLKAVGFSDADLKKPLIGVANTWIEIGPCNYHLRTLAADVKDGIRAAGGTPMEFNTVSISDGITMGTEGMRASLVSREVIADSIELVARGNGFDGLVVLVGCDKTIPGGVMALARLNVPGVVLYGGSIAPGSVQGQRGHHPGRVRGGRRPRGRHDERRRLPDARGRGLSRAPAPAAASSRRTRWRSSARRSASRRSAAAACRRPIRRRRPSRAGGGRAGRQAGGCRSQAARHHHARGRSRTPSPSSRRPADRPTPCCTCWRSRGRRASSCRSPISIASARRRRSSPT